MAYTTINKSTDYFNTKLYTGTGNEQAITGMGFQPDLTWIKRRNTTNSNNLFDTNRTASNEATLTLSSDSNSAENDVASSDFTSIDSNGFTVKGANPTGANGSTYVGWGWNANNGTTSSNTDGTITSTVQANTTAGFSIVSYTGNGTAGATIGHGLGATPAVIIQKITSSTGNWLVYHHKNTSAPETDFLRLNTNNATADEATIFNDTAPTSSVFSVGTESTINGNGNTCIAYCFAEKTGYSKFGSYTANAQADGPFVYTGFKPKFVIIKRYSDTGNWVIQDDKRSSVGGGNPNDKWLYANGNDADYDASSYPLDLLSNGFKIRHGGGSYQNAPNGATYLYLAFGQSLVGSNNIPCTAR